MRGKLSDIITEYYAGNTDLNLEFPSFRTSLMLSNDGTDSLFLDIGDFSIEVKAGEVLNECFRNFRHLKIKAVTPFRLWVRGEG